MTEPESTLDLLQRARSGDQQAADALFARYLPMLQRWATRRVPDWARDMTDTHDLVQDTLLQAFKKLDTFEYRGVGALQAYLRQVLVNRIRLEFRKKARRPDDTTLDDVHEDAGASPLEAAIGGELLDRYERALERLRPEEREVIIARVELELSYAELAEAVGKPSADAARKAAERALIRLAEEMDREQSR